MPSKYIKKYPEGRRVTRNCAFCGKEFQTYKHTIEEGYGLFCSHACKSQSQIKRIEVICKSCGKPFLVRPSEVKKGVKYCSWDCRKLGIRGPGNPAWKDDKNYRGYDWDKSREKALGRDENSCQVCGKTPSCVVHHIEKYDRHENNNELHNLVTLCVGCHKRVHSGSAALPGATLDCTLHRHPGNLGSAKSPDGNSSSKGIQPASSFS